MRYWERGGIRGAVRWGSLGGSPEWASSTMSLWCIASGENPKTQFSACNTCAEEGATAEEEGSFVRGARKAQRGEGVGGAVAGGGWCEEDNHERSKCKECGGSSICEHNRQRNEHDLLCSQTPEPHALLAPQTTRQANNRVRSRCTTGYRASAGIAGCRWRFGGLVLAS
jgi:hypothetical protein